MRIATIHRHPERAVPEEIATILAQGYVAHVAYVQDGAPQVLPTLYHYGPEAPATLYLHGAPASAMMKDLARGTQVCVSVALIDGLVFSRSAKYHSANYRSVVLAGHTQVIAEAAAKEAIFERMIARYFVGRTVHEDYAPAEMEHLRGVALIAVDIEEWSGKARRGGPKGPLDDDPTAPGTSGIAPITHDE
jgi:nitroimidazol reductase NimA-like FMN-containing flavoprotein (pyridoxamine 5'-phosphate oxidase superfamily)